jgi:hypothetical protein
MHEIESNGETIFIILIIFLFSHSHFFLKGTCSTLSSKAESLLKHEKTIKLLSSKENFFSSIFEGVIKEQKNHLIK